ESQRSRQMPAVHRYKGDARATPRIGSAPGRPDHRVRWFGSPKVLVRTSGASWRLSPYARAWLVNDAPSPNSTPAPTGGDPYEHHHNQGRGHDRVQGLGPA